MRSFVSTVLGLTAVAGAVACGSGTDAPEDANFEPFGCAALPGSISQNPTSLDMGYLENEAYVEINDNDQVPVVVGRQGLYMLVLQLRTGEAPPTDSFCLSCQQQVSGAGAFDGVAQDGEITFSAEAEAFAGDSVVILGGGSEVAAALDGAEVEVSVTCTGHGVDASATRSLTLVMPEL